MTQSIASNVKHDHAGMKLHDKAGRGSPLAERNRQPQRYGWRAEGAASLEKIVRARAKLEEIMPDTSRTAD